MEPSGFGDVFSAVGFPFPQILSPRRERKGGATAVNRSVHRWRGHGVRVNSARGEWRNGATEEPVGRAVK